MSVLSASVVSGACHDAVQGHARRRPKRLRAEGNKNRHRQKNASGQGTRCFRVSESRFLKGSGGCRRVLDLLISLLKNRLYRIRFLLRNQYVSFLWRTHWLEQLALSCPACRTDTDKGCVCGTTPGFTFKNNMRWLNRVSIALGVANGKANWHTKMHAGAGINNNHAEESGCSLRMASRSGIVMLMMTGTQTRTKRDTSGER